MKGTLDFKGNLLKANPNQNVTTNMITPRASFSTLASLNLGQRLALVVKWLDFPAQSVHILDALAVVLR